MRVAIYARYSDEQQRETSIDDQIRRCTELAQRHGWSPGPELTFLDAALSGTEKHLKKREGYRSLMEAWDQRRFDVLIVDEPSRLARDAVETALLIRRLEKSPVEMLTANGIDTRIPNWQLLVGMHGMVDQQATRNTRHRVIRGMEGQLERGFMVGYPSFGYRLDRKFNEQGDRVGTLWRKDEAEAALVREIYDLRRNGGSLSSIARMLNARGIATPKGSRTALGGYWRPGQVHKLIQSPIYRGEVAWNDSDFLRHKAGQTGRKLEPKRFPRPELRIVDDETWYACNRGTHSRTRYGGGRHALAGLVSCGACGSTLSIGGSKTPSLCCAQCSQASRVTTDQGTKRLTGSVSIRGVQLLLHQALRDLLTPAVVEEFRARLRARLTGGVETELAEVKREIEQAKRAGERLARLITAAEEDDPILEAEYRRQAAVTHQLRGRLAELETRREIMDRSALDKQLQVDPAVLLETLFAAEVAPEKLRAILARILPLIQFLGKTGRMSSVFQLTFSPGAAAALASGTDPIVNDALVRRYQLSTTGKRPTTWTITPLNDA